MKTNLRVSLVLFAALIGCSIASAADSGLRLGYRLGFSFIPLNASKIDAGFLDLRSGHTSAFYIERFLSDSIYIAMSPGAWNSEQSNNTQFTIQYNLVSMGYKGTGRVFANFGSGVGAGIFSLTGSSSSELGTLQTGTALRSTSFMWTGHFGVGYRSQANWDYILEVRNFGFFHDQFSKLNALTAGFSVSTKI